MAEQKTQEPTVKVRILKAMAGHQPGDVVELPESEAKSICRVSKVQNGHEVEERRRAVLVSEEHTLSKEHDLKDLTLKEAQELGLKNRIASPYDTHPAHKALENTQKLEGKKDAVDTKAEGEDTVGQAQGNQKPAVPATPAKGKQK